MCGTLSCSMNARAPFLRRVLEHKACTASCTLPHRRRLAVLTHPCTLHQPPRRLALNDGTTFDRANESSRSGGSYSQRNVHPPGLLTVVFSPPGRFASLSPNEPFSSFYVVEILFTYSKDYQKRLA